MMIAMKMVFPFKSQKQMKMEVVTPDVMSMRTMRQIIKNNKAPQPWRRSCVLLLCFFSLTLHPSNTT